MESVNKLRRDSVITLLLVAAMNSIDCMKQSVPLWHWLAFVGPFVVLAAIIHLWKHYMVPAVAFSASAMVMIFTGATGNVSGAAFLMLSFYIFRTRTSTIIILAACGIATVARYVLNDYTIPDTANQIILYAFLLKAYFDLIHPKRTEKTDILIAKDTLEMIKMLRERSSKKEIASIFDLTTSAVYKRISAAQKAYECKDDDELIEKLENLGIIPEKSDNSA